MADLAGQYVLFSGCASERGGQPARRATIALAKDLHIELWEAPSKGCCGARADRRVGEQARERTLAPLFEGMATGLDIVCLSPACQCVVAAQVAAGKGNQAAGTPRVWGVAQLLGEQYGWARLSQAAPSGLTGLRVALHTVCHGDHNPPRGAAAPAGRGPAGLLARLLPRSRRADPDAAMYAAMGSVPALSGLVSATGATSIGDASARGACAMHPLLKRGALPLMGASGTAPCLAAAARAGADVVVTPCFLCFMGLNSYQRRLPVADPARGVPVLHLSQLLGVACEVSPRNLSLSNTTVSARRVLNPFVV